MNSRITLLIALLCVFMSSAALAADRTFCGSLQFRDIRDGCGGGAPNYRDGQTDGPCGTSTYQYAAWMIVDVYDYDDGGAGDDYIGRWYINGYQGFCITFPWEGESYQLGETHPDPYIRVTLWDWKTVWHTVHAKLYPSGNTPTAISFYTNRYTDCQRGTTCNLPNVNYISTSETSQNTHLANMGDSGAHAMRVYGASSHAAQMEDVNLNYCSSGDPCDTSASSWDGTNAFINWSDTDDPYAPPHEIGHLYAEQLFESNGPGPISYCLNDPGCDHGVASTEYDKTATWEGWASYIAAVSWWSPDDSDSTPYFWSWSVEDATPPHTGPGDTAADNRGIELQATRGFWDLDDARQDSSVSPCPNRSDQINLWSRSDIATAWLNFADGSGNRQEEESDYNGTNLWDYWYNTDWGNDEAAVWTTLIDMQCQYSMDYN